jgi:SAM-dependent methyltransferase
MRRPEEFEAMYAGTPPWDIGRPQPAFLRLATAGQIRGRVLDVGCGTGEHALMAAGLGLDATGVDTAPTAIETAKAKARERGLSTRFLVWNALELGGLGETFDTVLDSGLFHVFDDDSRVRYVESLETVSQPGSRYFLLCFSELQPGELGPRRVSEAEIRASFARGWRIDSLERTTLDVNGEPHQVHAWLAAMTRT